MTPLQGPQQTKLTDAMQIGREPKPTPCDGIGPPVSISLSSAQLEKKLMALAGVFPMLKRLQARAANKGPYN